MANAYCFVVSHYCGPKVETVTLDMEYDRNVQRAFFFQYYHPTQALLALFCTQQARLALKARGYGRLTTLVN